MVKIIFSRVGKKGRPQYRIVALDKQKDPWGDSLEILGHYNPHTKELKISENRILDWIQKGAQPSASIHNLLVEKGIIKDKKIRVSTISKKRQAKLSEKTKANEDQEANDSAEAKPEVKESPAEAKPQTEAKPEVKKSPTDEKTIADDKPE